MLRCKCKINPKYEQHDEIRLERFAYQLAYLCGKYNIQYQITFYKRLR